MAGKATRILGAIFWVFGRLEAKEFLLFIRYTSDRNWSTLSRHGSPHFRKDIEVLEKIQRRAKTPVKLPRLLAKIYFTNWDLQLWKTDWFYKADLNEMFKIINGTQRGLHSDSFIKLGVSACDLRGHCRTLKVFRRRLDVTEFSFSRRVVGLPVWNRVCDRVVSCSVQAKICMNWTIGTI